MTHSLHTIPKRSERAVSRSLYPFTSRYMDVNGHRLHYIDEGAGEPVVMLHGNPTWSFYYRHLIQTLSPGFRALAPDHIGCGLSDKPHPASYGYRLENRVSDLETFLGNLEIREGITLVLHDWGGMIGLAYALRQPDRIRRLVVTNTSGFFPPGGRGLPIRLRIIRNLRILAVPAVLGLNLFSFAASFMASGKGLAPDVRAGLRAPYNTWRNRMATLKFVQDIPLAPEDPSYRLVREVDDNLHRLSGIPMLICWGERDFVFTTDYRDEWSRRFPGAELRSFPGAGHYLLEDEPDRVSGYIKDFLKRTDRFPPA